MCAWCAVPLCSSLRAGRFSAWHRYEQLGEALHSVHGMLLLLLSLLLCARRVLVPVLLRCTVLLLVVLLVLLPPPSLAMERVGGVLQLQPSPPQSPPSVAMERVGVLQLQSPPPQLPPSVAMERMGGVLLLQSRRWRDQGAESQRSWCRRYCRGRRRRGGQSLVPPAPGAGKARLGVRPPSLRSCDVVPSAPLCHRVRTVLRKVVFH